MSNSLFLSETNAEIYMDQIKCKWASLVQVQIQSHLMCGKT